MDVVKKAEKAKQLGKDQVMDPNNAVAPVFARSPVFVNIFFRFFASRLTVFFSNLDTLSVLKIAERGRALKIVIVK